MPKSTLLMEMIDLLRERPGITVDALAHAMRRSERTIYRWMSDIASRPRMCITCREGGYYLSESAAARSVDLTPQELLALSMSLKSAPFESGSPVGRHASSAWLKIRDAVCWEKLEAASGMAATHSIALSAPPTELPNGLVETLDRAVDGHHRLRVTYRSQKSNTVRDYTIDPYAMVFRRHSWYLVGHCIERGRVIQLKLVRFINAVDSGGRFQPPDDFSIQRYFALSWEAWAGGDPVTVRVRFSPEVAQMIAESRRHPTQAIYPEPDGSVVYEVTVAGIEEIAIWIMGYGKHAVVVEPESLRKYVLDHAQATVANYTSDSLLRSAPSTART